MFDLLRSRGLEIFLGVLLLTGEANIVSITLNKEAGFFTFNVGSDWFVWQQPLVGGGPEAPMETPTAPPGSRAFSQGSASPTPAGDQREVSGCYRR